MDKRKLVRPEVYVTDLALRDVPLREDRLECLRRELVAPMLFNEVHGGDEEQRKYIEGKKSPIDSLEVLEELNVHFPVAEEELESMRQELAILELFGNVYAGEEQHKYIEGKKSQIEQLEEALGELRARKREAEDMLKDAEQSSFALVAATIQINVTSGVAYELYGIIVWLMMLLALVYSHWQEISI